MCLPVMAGSFPSASSFNCLLREVGGSDVIQTSLRSIMLAQNDLGDFPISFDFEASLLQLALSL